MKEMHREAGQPQGYADPRSREFQIWHKQQRRKKRKTPPPTEPEE